MDNCTQYVGQHSEMLRRHELDISKLKDDRDNIIEVGILLKQIKEDVEKMNKKLDAYIESNDKRITELEKAPGQSAMAYWKVVITGLITGGLGFLIAQILK